ncbi:MAG TPA: type II toxin-antitoxin system prevent-host-death family antitoxin [Mycobacteriales bacterium]|nr:type II toxin-antitoxin system prevent-host-death family antitoxin [Mycobacteriales bacterium]
MERIGVRELRQHASRYLARVASGETVEVTDRGRPVALLVPVGGERWEQLLASGRVHRPDDESELTAEPAADYGVDASGVLAAAREHER